MYQTSNKGCSWLVAVCTVHQLTNIALSQKPKAQWGRRSVSVSQAPVKHRSKCKEIHTEWWRGDKHTLKSSTLIHCIRCRNNSPAAISQRGHSPPPPSPLCQSKLTCHHLTILIKPQVQSKAARWTPYLTFFSSVPVTSVMWHSCLFGVQCG